MGDQRSDTVDGLDGRRNDCQIIRIGFWDFVVHARPGRDMVSGGDDVVVTGVAVGGSKCRDCMGCRIWFKQFENQW